MRSSVAVALALLPLLAQIVGCQKNATNRGAAQYGSTDSLALPGTSASDGDLRQIAGNVDSGDVGISLDSLAEFSSSVNDSNASTFFGLYVLRADKIQGRDYHEILLVGRYSEGGFHVLKDESEPTLETLPGLPATLRFKQHRSFVPYYSGRPIGQGLVSRVRIESFDCSELVVGLCSPLEPISSLSSPVVRAGFSEAKELDYSLSFAFVLEAPWCQTHLVSRSTSAPILVSEGTSTTLIQYCRDRFRQSLPNLPDTSFKASAIRPFRIGADTAYVLTAVARTDSIILSVAIAARVEGHTVAANLEVTNENEPSSWGSGHELLDVLDIDGDGNAELIFIVGYYEETGIEIYKLHGDKYKKVFDAIPWGC